MVRIVWIAVVALGCGGKDEGSAAGGSSGGDTAAPPSAAITTVVDAWKKGGLTPSALAPAKAFGKDCQGGAVNNVDVLICEFPNPTDAKAAEKPGFDWVGETTGAAWVSGSLVIAVADRKKADKDGKTINQLMKLTPK